MKIISKRFSVFLKFLISFLFLCCLAALLVCLQNQSDLKRFWTILIEVFVAKQFSFAFSLPKPFLSSDQ